MGNRRAASAWLVVCSVRAVGFTVAFVALAVLVDGAAGLVGGLLSERWLARRKPALIGFAAGALVSAAFLDVMPEAVQAIGASALWYAFAGFGSFAVFEWALGPHHGHTASHGVLPAGLLVSDGLHNIGDGASVAAAFLVSPALGVTVTIAVIAHEVPQEVGDFVLLRDAGLRRGRALLALASVQATAAIGAAAVLVAASSSRLVIDAILAVAAGGFLYIGATDLLPELREGTSTHERRARMIGFLAGIAAIVVVTVW